MGPAWVLLAPDGPHVGPMSLAIRAPWLANLSFPEYTESTFLFETVWLMHWIVYWTKLFDEFYHRPLQNAYIKYIINTLTSCQSLGVLNSLTVSMEELSRHCVIGDDKRSSNKLPYQNRNASSGRVSHYLYIKVVVFLSWASIVISRRI